MNGTRHDPVPEAEAIEDLRVGAEREEVTQKGSTTVGARASSVLDLLDTITGRWGSPHRSPLPGILWAGALLSLLAWLDHQHLGLLLISLIASEKFEPAGFAAPLGHKDIRLALSAAEALTVPLPLASLLHDRFLRLLANGGEGLDWSAIGGLAARDAGLS